MGVLLRTLILGIVTGSIYALASTGLVLMYKTSGVLNFGYGALALLTSFVHWHFAVEFGMPVLLSAALVVLVVAPLIGLFLDRQLFSRIQGQPIVITVIATVGLLVLVQGLVALIWNAETKRVPPLLGSGTVSLPGGVNIGADDVAIFFVATGAAVLLAAMFRFTRIGVAFRAVVDNRPIAGLMAINTGLISGLAWALGTSFAALTGILLTQKFLLDPIFLPPFVISQVLAAAIVGYMRSLPAAYAGGIALGVIQALLIQYAHFGGFLTNLPNAVPFLMIFLLVLLAPRSIRTAGLGASFVVRAREVTVQAGRAARGTVGVAVFGFLALVPVIFSASPSWTDFMTTGLTYSVIFLSLVILTGYSGQLSLGHTAFAGISAFTAANFITERGWPVWAAMLLGIVLAVPAGALIGFLAVRIHGLYLALMTLAFAFMAHELLFKDIDISGGFPGIALPRPAAFRGDRAFFYLVLAFLAGSALLAVSLRSGRTGRVLAGMRDSETACRSLGIDVTRYKVLIFSLSAAMAGLGGILFGMGKQNVNQQDFLPFFALIYVTLAVIGGIFHVGGAIASGLLYGLFPKFSGFLPFLDRIQLILFGLGATLALAQNPEGLFGELRRGAAAVTRLLERRRAGAAPVPVRGGQR